MQKKYSHSFIYDYALVTGHCTGQCSLLYYLYKMGSPSTLWSNRRACFESMKSTFGICGITVDRAEALEGEDDDIDSRNVPVIWLVRDPVEVLSTYINWHLGEHITGSGRAHCYSSFPAKNIYAMNAYVVLTAFWRQCFAYTQTLYRLPEPSRLKLLDTQDLYGDVVCTTMRDIAAFLGIRYNHTLDTCFVQRFNDFSARLWARFPSFDIKKKEVLHTFVVLPEKFSESYFFVEDTPLSEDVYFFESRGARYALVRTAGDAEALSTEDFYEMAFAAIHQALSIREELAAVFVEQYTKRAITPQETCTLLREENHLRDLFMSAQEASLKHLLAINPSHLERWKHYISLL